MGFFSTLLSHIRDFKDKDRYFLILVSAEISTMPDTLRYWKMFTEWANEGQLHLNFLGDFPGPVIRNPLCNAGDAGSTPGQGTRIWHAVEQLSLLATAKEPMCHNEGCWMM